MFPDPERHCKPTRTGMAKLFCCPRICCCCRDRSRAGRCHLRLLSEIQTPTLTFPDTPTSSCEQSRVVVRRMLHGSSEVGQKPKEGVLRVVGDGKGFCDVQLTGQTTGMPPRTGFEPSKAAFSLNHMFSPPAVVHEVTVAP